MAIIDDFKARFPEFDTATVDQYLPILSEVYPAYFNGDYENNKEIILNLIAHLLVNETNTGSSTVKDANSKSVGDVSVGYSDSKTENMRDAWFFATKYGARYLMLIRSRSGAFFV